MNKAISALVAVASTVLVIGAVVYGLAAVLGQWSTLLWIVLGWCLLMGIAKRVNS